MTRVPTPATPTRKVNVVTGLVDCVSVRQKPVTAWPVAPVEVMSPVLPSLAVAVRAGQAVIDVFSWAANAAAASGVSKSRTISSRPKSFGTLVSSVSRSVRWRRWFGPATVANVRFSQALPALVTVVFGDVAFQRPMPLVMRGMSETVSQPGTALFGGMPTFAAGFALQPPPADAHTAVTVVAATARMLSYVTAAPACATSNVRTIDPVRTR